MKTSTLTEFWKRLDGGDDTVFDALQHSCGSLANACTVYGTHVIEARNEIDGILGELALELIASGIVIALATIYTAGTTSIEH